MGASEQSFVETEVSIGSLIASAHGGDDAVAADLFAHLYAELQGLARRELACVAGRWSGISANSLLHETYLAVQRTEGAQFSDRGRFLSYASKVMRSLIINHARRRGAQKRGGQFEMTTLEPERALPAGAEIVDGGRFEELGRALEELEKVEPALAEVVDLKYFCGMSLREIAELTKLSERTLQRRWDKARLFLHSALKSS